MLAPSQFYKCLSDDTRLHAMTLIYTEGELCVCELVAALNDSQPKISRHLAQLRNCGLLEDTRRGHWVFYSVANHLPEWAKDILRISSQVNATSLGTFQNNLQGMKNRPQCC